MHDEIAEARSPAHERTPAGRIEGNWFERTVLLLGTFVTLGTTARDAAAATAALDDATAAIADVQRLMSFHDALSDVSRINRGAAREAVRIAPTTAEVLRLACEFSRASAGAFDVTVAPQLVAAGLLPVPAGAPAPDERACWRDLEFVSDDEVIAHRALWIDLGGIAKGYAVDAAWQRLHAAAPLRCRVNAGGDLRLSAQRPEPVLLDVPDHARDAVPLIELADGSIASSGGAPAARNVALTNADDARRDRPHVDGRTRRAIETDAFACVVATRCVVADALTKIVLAAPELATALLDRHDAMALLHRPARGWHTLGRAA